MTPHLINSETNQTTMKPIIKHTFPPAVLMYSPSVASDEQKTEGGKVCFLPKEGRFSFCANQHKPTNNELDPVYKYPLSCIT